MLTHNSGARREAFSSNCLTIEFLSTTTVHVIDRSQTQSQIDETIIGAFELRTIEHLGPQKDRWMKKYIVEFNGTFFLVFTIGNVVLHPQMDLILGPLAIVPMLTVMVYAGGHISGAHFHPAITLSITLRGKCSVADAVPYVVAQIVAAIVGAVAVIYA